MRGLCREASPTPVTRSERSPAIEPNHQLFEWVLPPLVISPVRAHAEALPHLRPRRKPSDPDTTLFHSGHGSALARGADVPQGEVPLAVEEIEKRQNQRRRDYEDRRGNETQPAYASGEKLKPIEQAPREQAEIASGREQLADLKAGLLEQVRETANRGRRS